MVLDDALHNADYANYQSSKKWRKQCPHQFGVDLGHYGIRLEVDYRSNRLRLWGTGAERCKRHGDPRGGESGGL